jgi:fructose-specific phosphotransferase system IIC component
MSLFKREKATSALKKATTVDAKSKSFIQNATDTFREVAFIFMVAIFLGGVSYSFFEHKPLVDGLIWAVTTGFTIGYNDIVPTTIGGDVTARVLMTLSAYVIIPLITALMTYKMLKGHIADVTNVNARLLAHLDELDAKKPKARITKVKAKD